MANWNDVTTTPPPERQEVLVYTEDGKMRVCMYYRGIWNTYMKVTHWMEKPDKPEKDVVIATKKRGRPRK